MANDIPTELVPFAFETVTVSNSAKKLTYATYTPAASSSTPQPGALMALLSTETDSLRFRLDDTAPTSGVGHQLAAGSSLTIWGSSIRRITMIRSGSSDVPVSVTYFRQLGALV